MVIKQVVKDCIEETGGCQERLFRSERRLNMRSRTGRRRTDKAVRESESRFRSLFDQVQGIPIQGYDQDRNVIYWNRASEEVYGFTAAEALGRKLEDLIIPDAMRQQVIDDVRHWTAGGPAIPAGELVLKDKNGDDVRVYSSHVMLTNLSGGKEMFCVDVDMKPLRRAEEALRESEAAARAILNATRDAVMLLDRNGIILDGNVVQAERLKLTPGTLKGRCLWDFFPASVARRRREAVEKAFRTGFAVRLEDERDGLWYTATIEPVPDVQGRVQCVAIYSQDITERRHLQDRLQRMEKMESLGMMAGAIAHDLNNVLGILVGYAEMLFGDIPADSPLREHVKNIMDGGEKAAAVVQDLLTLARRGVHTKRVVSLNDIIAQYCRTLEFTKLICSHPDVVIKTDFTPELLNITGSPVHLEKMLMNLVLNAVEAMPGGGTLTIRTASRRVEKPIRGYDEIKAGEYTVLTVSDTGMGIPSADMKHIFEPFYTKKVLGRSGTGLGLAVVWGTVKDTGGFIDVTSGEGMGTTFTLYFPVTREDVSPVQAPVPEERYFGNGETVLVVDDEAGQRRLAALALARMNYRVVTAASGEKAVAYLKENKADLVILDMIMHGGMDGLDTYREMIKVHPGQRAVIVSGYSETERVYEAQRLGAGAYVGKPYIMERLGLAVRQELDRQ
jgi:two-component system cell cycle sensor histidine kinase/response regulator CckA